LIPVVEDQFVWIGDSLSNMQNFVLPYLGSIQVRKKLASLTDRGLFYHFSLLLVLLPLIAFIPSQRAASASSSTVQTILKSVKEINYYPENDAWTNMWLRFHPAEINNDFARIQESGFNTVRIILQAYAGVFDYPVPTPAELEKLSQVVTLAAEYHLKVHLTLFDDWGQYMDLVGSQQWADAIVEPYAGDPRVSIIELQNEMDLNATGSLTWAQTMIPYLRCIDGGIPVTISESGLARMERLVNALCSTPPDFYDVHLYEYDGRIYQTLKQVQALLQGAPFFIGETGYSTYPQSQGGFSGTAQNVVAQEAQQQYYYRMVFYAAKGLGLPFPTPWILSDFSSAAFPRPPQLATLQQAYFGLLRIDGSRKPAAETIASLLAGNPIETSFNNGFEQGDGQGLPTLWRIAQNASLGFTANFAQDTTVAHSGKASARISHSTESKYGTASFFLNPIQYVIPGQTYSVSVWGKGLLATGRDYLSIAWFDAAGHLLSENASPCFSNGTYDWQQRTLVARAPAQAAGMEIHLNSQGNTGTVWFDDVSFWA
jgi:hypothetical protein